MFISRIKHFFSRIFSFFRRKRPTLRKPSFTVPCQVCQSTGIPVGWVCIDCKRPICDECFHEIQQTGYDVQCFNPLCEKSSSNRTTVPSLEIVQRSLLQNASIDSNRFHESVFNSPFTLGDIIQLIQSQTPISYFLTLPLDQVKVAIYYGFMGSSPLTTQGIISVLKRINIKFETDLTDPLLQVLCEEGLIKRRDSVWIFPPKDERSPAPNILISPKGPPAPKAVSINHSPIAISTIQIPTRSGGSSGGSKFRMSQEELSLISTLEGLTGALAIDCIWEKEDNRVVFIVRRGDTAKVIGRGGTTIQRIREHFNKNIEVVEYSDTLEQFVRNTLAPAKVRKVELVEEDGEKNLVLTVIPREKGRVVGKNGRNIDRSRLLLKNHFGINNVILQSSDTPFYPTNAPINPERLQENVTGTSFILNDIVDALQENTPFSQQLRVPLDQVKVLLYYGFLSKRSLITRDVEKTLLQMNISYDFKRTGMLLKELAEEQFIDREERLSKNKRTYYLYTWPSKPPMKTDKTASHQKSTRKKFT